MLLPCFRVCVPCHLESDSPEAHAECGGWGSQSVLGLGWEKVAFMEKCPANCTISLYLSRTFLCFVLLFKDQTGPG